MNFGSASLSFLHLLAGHDVFPKILVVTFLKYADVEVTDLLTTLSANSTKSGIHNVVVFDRAGALHFLEVSKATFRHGWPSGFRGIKSLGHFRCGAAGGRGDHLWTEFRRSGQSENNIHAGGQRKGNWQENNASGAPNSCPQGCSQSRTKRPMAEGLLGPSNRCNCIEFEILASPKRTGNGL